MEDAFCAIAEGQKSVILCDRGVLDGKAYVKDKTWAELVARTGQSPSQLRDERYDGVVHLVTAAIGAENFYTLENNAARTETPEQAAELDRRLQDVYRNYRKKYFFSSFWCMCHKV